MRHIWIWIPIFILLLLMAYSAGGQTLPTANPQVNASPIPEVPVVDEAHWSVVAIPPEATVELRVPGRVALETTATGSAIALRLAQDVVIDGVTVAQAGMPVEGILTSERRGSYALRGDGVLRVRGRDLARGRPVRIRFRGTRSARYVRGNRPWNDDDLSGKKVIIHLIAIAIAVLGMGTH